MDLFFSTVAALLPCETAGVFTVFEFGDMVKMEIFEDRIIS